MTGRKQQFWCKRVFSVIMIIFAGIAVVIMVLMPFFGGLFLLSIDRYHECYRDFIINNWLEGDNYYDGELWFSAAATFIGAVISAVPGLMCGIFALVQTQRLHRLEARYHRPAMEIEKIGFSFVKISNIRDDSGVLRMDEFDIRQRSGVYEANEQSSKWWIDLEIVLYSNNGIPSLLRAVFDAERSEYSERSRDIRINQSADGYFTYEV